MQRFSIFFLAAMSLVLIAVFAVRPTNESVSKLPRVIEGAGGSLLQPAKALPDFTLVDSSGAAFTNENLRGRWTLLFMGFSACAHLCPPTLYKLGLLQDKLLPVFAEQGYAPVGVLFVSVDPGRDTVAVLREYIAPYGEGFAAVTGDEAQLNALVAGLGATSRVLIEPDSYTVEHSPAVYLLNPEGRLAGLFTPPLRIEAMSTDINKVAKGL